MFGIQISPEVVSALEGGRPVVALESTLIAHGLPRPRNLEVARTLEDDLRARGVTPATVAVLDGVPTVGLSAAGLERIASGDGVAKLSGRDLPVAAALGRTGATTVAATSLLAAAAGVRVFATGGLGGVHRVVPAGAPPTFDESADLVTLARTPITVVCAGVKSLLDVGATLERLETLGVPVLGWRTDTFPGFYLTETPHRLDWRVESAAQVAEAMAAADALGQTAGIVLANPVPPDAQLDPAAHDEVLAAVLAAAVDEGVRGKDVTPFLLAAFHRETAGASLEVNIRVVRGNVAVAAEVATAFAARRDRT